MISRTAFKYSEFSKSDFVFISYGFKRLSKNSIGHGDAALSSTIFMMASERPEKRSFLENMEVKSRKASSPSSNF